MADSLAMKSLLLILSTFVFISNSHADVHVSAPYSMVLGSEEMKAMLEQLSFSGKDEQMLEDVVIAQPFKTHLQKIKMTGTYEAQLSAGASVLDFAFSAKIPALVLTIGRISTDAVIDRIVGGVHVQIYLKGHCENVVIKGSESALFSSRVNLKAGENGLEPVLGTVVVNQLPQWAIDMGQCHGPLGYDKALVAEVNKILSNKDEVQKIISAPLANKLQVLAAQWMTKVLGAQDFAINPQVKVQLTPEALDVVGKSAMVLRGTATAQLQSSEQGVVAVDDAGFLAKSANAQETGFYISQKWLQKSIGKAQELGLLRYSFKSSSVEALKSLFSSRLYQFFLWPDLMRFARNVEFLFNLKVKSLEKMSYLYMSGGALWYDLHAKGSVDTKAPEKKGYTHYGDFQATLKTRVWVKLHKGVAVVGSYQPSFGLDFIWDKLYLKLFNPSQGISASYFARKIQSVIKDERHSFALPALQVSDTVKMRAEVLDGDADMLIIRYAPTSK